MRSGALITASWALEQGRDCYLVPGAIGAPTSAGCLDFLRLHPDLARIVCDVPGLIEDLGLLGLTRDGPADRRASRTRIGGAGARAGADGRSGDRGRPRSGRASAGGDGPRWPHAARDARPGDWGVWPLSPGRKGRRRSPCRGSRNGPPEARVSRRPSGLAGVCVLRRTGGRVRPDQRRPQLPWPDSRVRRQAPATRARRLSIAKVLRGGACPSGHRDPIPPRSAAPLHRRARRVDRRGRCDRGHRSARDRLPRADCRDRSIDTGTRRNDRLRTRHPDGSFDERRGDDHFQPGHEPGDCCGSDRRDARRRRAACLEGRWDRGHGLPEAGLVHRYLLYDRRGPDRDRQGRGGTRRHDSDGFRHPRPDDRRARRHEAAWRSDRRPHLVRVHVRPSGEPGRSVGGVPHPAGGGRDLHTGPRRHDRTSSSSPRCPARPGRCVPGEP